MSLIFFTLVLFTLVNLINGVPHNRQYDVKELTSSRIVGGQPAPDGFAPHMVALLVGDRFVLLVCGGSIVSTRHVLTAAHCIEAVVTWDGSLLRSLRGIVGTNKYTTNSYRNRIRFSYHINHPDYQPRIIKNDVGVLVTTQRIRLNDRIGVIPLKRGWVGGREKSYVTGWGINETSVTPEHLQLLHVKTISSEKCIAGVYKATQLLGPAPPIDPAVEICTLHSPGHGMCMGDSGSALVSEQTGQQIGIVSWGFPCALGFPDMFVRISGVWDFLQPIIEPGIMKPAYL